MPVSYMQFLSAVCTLTDYVQYYKLETQRFMRPLMSVILKLWMFWEGSNHKVLTNTGPLDEKLIVNSQKVKTNLVRSSSKKVNFKQNSETLSLHFYASIKLRKLVGTRTYFLKTIAFLNPSFTKGGGASRHPKGFSLITFDKNKLETPNFA